MPRLLCLAWALLLAFVTPATAAKRVALVIGNGAYQHVAALTHPIKDATAIAAMFKNAGFDWVKMRQDVGNLEFKRALREFDDAAQDADIAVVYYAGHGIRIKDMNYMIPVDAKLASEIDAENEAVSLDRIVIALEPAKRLRLVILDACRDNPFARTMRRRGAIPEASGGLNDPPRTGSSAVNSGLAKMEPTLGGTLIVYAAKAGSTAEDGAGQNSPFAAARLRLNARPPGSARTKSAPRRLKPSARLRLNARPPGSARTKSAPRRLKLGVRRRPSGKRPPSARRTRSQLRRHYQRRQLH